MQTRTEKIELKIPGEKKCCNLKMLHFEKNRPKVKNIFQKLLSTILLLK